MEEALQNTLEYLDKQTSQLSISDYCDFLNALLDEVNTKKECAENDLAFKREGMA